MADRKSFLLRIDRDVLDAVQRWADDELRSLNAQIEYVLRDALRKAGRLPRNNDPDREQEETK
ncbi:MAG TPA: Arc family DNA-binding protein [Xanthomonadaceae bacterium]|nr:Arc family DNA-binding protein [Xanthomonadaceae bacterium]